MPLSLVTGLPGAGKSLRLVQKIRAAVAKRPVYVFGLDGLQPFGWEPWDGQDWRNLPDGSLVVIDEAQKVWPSRRSGDPVDVVRELSMHRHRGFDFILATQHPTMLDAYVRKLIGSHEHVIRQFGARASRIVTWQECQDDPQSVATRARGTDGLWRYPVDCFPLYQSATQHTVKSKVPFRLLVLPVLLLVGVLCVWWGVGAVRDIGASPVSALPAPPVEPTGVAKPRTVGSSGVGKYGTAAEYAHVFTARVPGQPWTAPVYDGMGIASRPDVMCVISEAKGCRCYTEQVTRIKVPVLECRRMAREGVYNPLRAALREGQASPSGGSSSRSSKPGAASGA